MDWEQQAQFLQRWPELHSLFAAYIALEDEDMDTALQAFISENNIGVVNNAKTQLQQLIESNNQAWWLTAAQLCGVKSDDHQAWLSALLQGWAQK